MQKYPVMLCDTVGSGNTLRWRFWCKFCDTYHHHSPQPGHRLAHCSEGVESPYRDSGYVLELDRRSDIKIAV